MASAASDQATSSGAERQAVIVPYPVPPPPPGGYGCPRCGSPHTTEDDLDARFLLMALLNNTRCNSCGFAFNGKTGKSTTPLLYAMIAVPVVVAFGLLWLLYALAR